jgi:hypothetical protein
MGASEQNSKSRSGDENYSRISVSIKAEEFLDCLSVIFSQEGLCCMELLN